VPAGVPADQPEVQRVGVQADRGEPPLKRLGRKSLAVGLRLREVLGKVMAAHARRRPGAARTRQNAARSAAYAWRVFGRANSISQAAATSPGIIRWASGGEAEQVVADGTDRGAPAREQRARRVGRREQLAVGDRGGAR
jgi:hypothetical protein